MRESLCKLVLSVALALSAFVLPASAQASPGRTLRSLMARAEPAVRRFNQASDPSINVGAQGRRNAVSAESRAVQGPPNSYGDRPRSGN